MESKSRVKGDRKTHERQPDLANILLNIDVVHTETDLCGAVCDVCYVEQHAFSAYDAG